MIYFYFLLISIYSIGVTSGYTILASVGYGGHSHAFPLLELSNTLSSKGHEIVFASLDDSIKHANGYNLTTVSLGPNIINEVQHNQHYLKTIQSRGSKLNAMKDSVFPELIKTYKSTFNSLKHTIQLVNPDLMMCDFIAHSCIDLAKSLSIPLVVTMQTTDGIGLVNQPYLVDDLEYGPIFTYEMTLLQRIKAKLIQPIQGLVTILPLINQLNQLREYYKVGFTTFTVFGESDRYALSLANTFQGFEPNAPLPPNMHHIGPLLNSKKQTLNKELEQFMMTHQRIIYVGFGSLSVLGKDHISKIYKALTHLIENQLIDGVVWGLGRTPLSSFPDVSQQSKHIKLSSWAPQIAILNHPNTRLFISHCGLASSFESLHAKKPLVCLSLFGDQFRNAKKLETLGVASYLDKDTLTTKSVFRTILKKLKDPKIQSRLNIAHQLVINGSKRRNYAADLIIGHLELAKACRPLEPYNVQSNLPSCELAFTTPMDYLYSLNLRYALDTYLILFLSLLIILVLVGRLAFHLGKLIVKISCVELPKFMLKCLTSNVPKVKTT